MVSKLKFKGSKRKQHTTTNSHSESTKKLKTEENEKQNKHDNDNEDDNEDEARESLGWINAKSLSDDLRGPAVIIFNDKTSNQPMCICYRETLSTMGSKEFQIYAKPITDINSHPLDVKEVFIIYQIPENINLFSIKCPLPKTYLSIEQEDNSNICNILSSSMAIGPSEQFIFEYETEKSGWVIKTISQKFIQFKFIDNKLTAQLDNECQQYFTVRIQKKSKSDNSNLQTTAGVVYDVTKKIPSKELEKMVKRKLSKEEKKKLRDAFREGRLNEALLDVRQKGQSDRMC